ncbi:MAG: efflux RND transporter periplasmic adaptor subunit [Cryomorphaceae bacterium]
MLLAACNNREEGINPSYSAVTESVYASVTVQPEGLYNVYASVPGILDSLSVTEGDTVRAGEVIAKMVSVLPALSLENARLNVDLAAEKLRGRANELATLAQEIAIARDQLRLDSLNYMRQKNLWEQRIGSQVEFENRKLRYEQAANNLAILEQRYEQTHTELRNAYARSKNALAQAETNLQDHSVRARIAGKVYSLPREEGEFILNQEIIAQVGSRDTFLIEMAVDEVDVTRLEVGQMALVVLDAYSDQVFKAQVSRIYPQKDERSQTFKVEARFRQAPKVLYAGLSGEANILIQTIDRTLVIPLEYLGPENTVQTDTGVISVKTGIRNMEAVEIVSGLDTSSVIFKP